MNIESLGRQAIERIKSQWGLPKSGFIAGGSIANIVWELVSGNKAIINDVDVFVFDSIQEKFDNSDKTSLFNYQERETKYYEDYIGMCFNTYTKDFYSIVESTKDDIFNIVKYKSNSKDPSLIIKSFDINATRIGYSIEKDEIYWTPDFEEFLKTGTLKVTNLMTPSHTSVRIAKKSKELNAKIDTFEFKLLQYALGHNFSDRIKFRFKERYHQMYKDNLDILDSMFYISRDKELEQYVKSKYGETTELYYLNSKIEGIVPDDFTFDFNNRPSFESIFGSIDNNVYSINRSVDFLFYMRNIWGNKDLENIWSKVYYFFTDVSYIDRVVNQEDLELLSRFSKYAPDSIENLRGLKLSEQIDIIKMFLDKFKEDPIIAISILEKNKLSKDIILDEQTTLLLELSVRKKIVNDTKNKVGRIIIDDNKD
jgi:hypothetical protein